MSTSFGDLSTTLSANSREGLERGTPVKDEADGFREVFFAHRASGIGRRHVVWTALVLTPSGEAAVGDLTGGAVREEGRVGAHRRLGLELVGGGEADRNVTLDWRVRFMPEAQFGQAKPMASPSRR